MYTIYGPMGLVIYVRVNADDVIDDTVDVQKKLKDLRPAMASLAEHMRRSFKENFKKSGRPEPWQRIKTGTAMARMMRTTRFSKLTSAFGSKRNRAPLVDSGELMASYTVKGANHIEVIKRDSLVIGSGDPVSVFHEYGTGVHGKRGRPFEIKARRGKALRFMTPTGPAYAKSVQNPGVPPRPVAIIQDEDLEEAISIILKHIEGED